MTNLKATKGVTINTYIIFCLLECIFWIPNGQRKSPMEGTVSPKVDIRIEKNRNETNEHESSVEHTAMTRDYATEVNTQIIPETETKHIIFLLPKPTTRRRAHFLPPGGAHVSHQASLTSVYTKIHTSHINYNKFEKNSSST